MKEFVPVARLDKLPESRGTLVVVEGEEIALFKRKGEIYALSNVCAHQHFSKLHEGETQEYQVTCPMHGWTYDIRTGSATSGQGKVSVFEVRIVGNDVHIAVER